MCVCVCLCVRPCAGTAWEEFPDEDKEDEKVPGRAVLPEGVKMVEVCACACVYVCVRTCVSVRMHMCVGMSVRLHTSCTFVCDNARQYGSFCSSFLCARAFVCA
jgi:hypothetical protein